LIQHHDASNCIVITNDGGGLCALLAQHFISKDCRVVVLSLSKEVSIPGAEVLVIENLDESLIKNAIDKIISTYGDITSFINLQPNIEGNHQQKVLNKEERQLLKFTYLITKYIQPHINKIQSTRSAFLAVSQVDGSIGLGNHLNNSQQSNGLSGLIKSLNIEWPNVFCRAVDIAPSLDTQSAINAIINEYNDANQLLTEVGIDEGGRRTIAAKNNLVDQSKSINIAISTQDVFLVSGGGRGVTASCIIEMSSKCKNKFIIIGRSSIDFELPSYAQNDVDDATLKSLIMNDLKASGAKADLATVKKMFSKFIAKKEVEQTLSALKKNGSEAIYLAADVMDLNDMKAKIQTAQNQIGAITGIIHGAGVLADKLIQNKTESDFDNVLTVKLDGLENMLQVIEWSQLKNLILFSSVAGFYGNNGQSDYAMANEILNKWAHLIKKNHPHINISSINWGAWEGGMVTPELKKQFLAHGISLVNPEGGTAMFVNELNIDYKDQAQVIIGGTLPTPQSDVTTPLKKYEVNRILSLEDNPFLNHHVIQGNPVLPMANAISWMIDSCLTFYPDFHVSLIENAKLMKGIVVMPNAPTEYKTIITELEKTADKIVSEVTITSKGKKLPFNHYSVIVTMVHSRSKDVPPTHETNASKLAIVKEGSLLYQDGTLFHGPQYQGIKSILKMEEDEVILHCNCGKVSLEDQGKFTSNTTNSFVLDSLFQGLLVYAQHFYNGIKSLPLKSESSKIYRVMEFDKDFYCTLNITEKNDIRVLADCTIYDEEGLVYLTSKNIGITLSKEMKW
jgi:NAD(P)-dependent dehydrogenase (short-subunit alcohol dehydrogenase family)